MALQVADMGMLAGGSFAGLGGLALNHMGQRRGLRAMRGVVDQAAAENAALNARADGMIDQHLRVPPTSTAGAQDLFRATNPGPMASASAGGGDLSRSQQAALRVGLLDAQRSQTATARRDAVLQAIRQSLAQYGLQTSSLAQRLRMLEDERQLRQAAFEQQLQAASMEGIGMRQLGQVGLVVAPGLLRGGLQITPQGGSGSVAGPMVSPQQAGTAPRGLSLDDYWRSVGG